MINKVRAKSPLPPRLSMDEYADFMTQNMEHRAFEQTLIQKNMEERIIKAFVLHADNSDAHA